MFRRLRAVLNAYTFSNAEESDSFRSLFPIPLSSGNFGNLLPQEIRLRLTPDSCEPTQSVSTMVWRRSVADGVAGSCVCGGSARILADLFL